MKLITDNEFGLLYDTYRLPNLDLPYDSFPPFYLSQFNEDECSAQFGFKRADISTLKESLQIPPVIRSNQGSVCDGTEALCMLLRRLSYPCRYSDMVPLFAKPVPVISMITNEVLDYVYESHSHRIVKWNHEPLSPVKLEEYANAVTRKGAPLDSCFAFVDGTVRLISRLGQNQRIVYNGHKHVHSIKFQSVVAFERNDCKHV